MRCWSAKHSPFQTVSNACNSCDSLSSRIHPQICCFTMADIMWYCLCAPLFAYPNATVATRPDQPWSKSKIITPGNSIVIHQQYGFSTMVVSNGLMTIYESGQGHHFWPWWTMMLRDSSGGPKSMSNGHWMGSYSSWNKLKLKIKHLLLLHGRNQRIVVSQHTNTRLTSGVYILL